MMYHSFSIITTIYKKQKELPFFLNAFLNQVYQGKWEIICVVDNSPDKSIEILREFETKSRDLGVDLVVVNNQQTVGNCVSRNTGIEIAKNDIIVIIDSDCVPSADFLEIYNNEYNLGDCDVAVGPLGFETCGANPFSIIHDLRLKKDCENIHTDIQDPMNRRSFLNTVTRNFTIKRKYLIDNYKGESFFDPQFSHIASDPKSGFGWEDIEMGYRLYKKGARLKYVENNPVVHISHPPVITNAASIPPRSMLNFRRMFDKHPDMALVARRWAVDVLGKIYAWEQKNGHNPEKDENYKRLKEIFVKHIPYSYKLRRGNRLRILTYRWHVGHQYELHKLPYDFTLVTGSGSSVTNAWPYSSRPLPHNDTLKKLEDIDVKDYDLAIVHFDENALNYENTNNVIGPDWGLSLKYFMANIPLPKIGVCHGTPQFYGAYTPNYSGSDLLQTIESSRENLVDFVGDTLIICNSHQALKEWQFKNSRCIWHGYDPFEFPPSLYEKKVLAFTNMNGRPHYRGEDMLNKVTALVSKKITMESLSVPEPAGYSDNRNNNYAYAKFRNYVDAIRQYSVYFNPTLRSPMPRSRTEAMMCGVVIVSTNNHDVDMFIKNGTNGFYSNDPSELAENILYLCGNPDACKKMGDESRKTACDIFNHDRYLHEWQEAIKDVIGKC
jgi:glycosyltransferase involved in cell wall biosynthesis